MGLKKMYGMYLDDIIVYSTSVEQCLVQLYTILSYLWDFTYSSNSLNVFFPKLCYTSQTM